VKSWRLRRRFFAWRPPSVCAAFGEDIFVKMKGAQINFSWADSIDFLQLRLAAWAANRHSGGKLRLAVVERRGRRPQI
jgi:hypothetical protein